MAISFIAKHLYNSGTGGSTTVTNNVPTGTTAGDFIVWAMYGNNNTLPDVPDGWNILHQQSGTAQAWTILWRAATSAEPASYSITVASSRWAAAMLTYRGVDVDTPEDVASTSAASTTGQTFTAITPTTTGAWVLAFAGAITVSNANSFASSNLDVIDVNTADGSSSLHATLANASFLVGHEAWAAGAFTSVVTKTQTSTRTQGIQIALRPAAATYPEARVSAVAAEALVTVSRSDARVSAVALEALVRKQRPGVNLLENPSFEMGMPGWSTEGGLVTVSTVRARTGTKSLLLTNTPGGTINPQKTITALLNPNTYYLFSGWFYSLGTNIGIATQQPAVRMGGSGMVDPASSQDAGSTTARDTWVFTSRIFATLPTVGQGVIYVYGANGVGDQTWWDDLSLTEVYPSAGNFIGVGVPA